MRSAQIGWKRPIPTLPKNRPRPITPTETSEEQREAGKPIARNGIFFEKLPAELRYKILVEAFGEQVVHMDLFYDHPFYLPGEVIELTLSNDYRPNHGGLNGNQNAKGGQSPLLVNRHRPKQWAWRSSVCHRDSPDAYSRPPGRRVQPAQDRCRFGGRDRRYCESWPGEGPSKCFIGIMGWLLSCRQAYLEGIEVLYSTNTFNMASKEMVMNLPRLLIPQRLEAITSVEILWDWEPFLRQDETAAFMPLSDKKSFHAFLDFIPIAFPKIRSLYVSLQGKLHGYRTSQYPPPAEERFGILEETIMIPVDNMVRTLGTHVQDISVAIPSTLYFHYRERAQSLGWKVEQTCVAGQLERHWRPLTDCEFRAGYWVPLGQRDLHLASPPLVVQSQFNRDTSEDSPDNVLFGFD
ncbi:hypothetical protein BKA56DRAFT_472834 [Ilyonectria sp. MPI-CAGE-AT-0026]|nr:hypothetical protein BKA56DRAFT_472834 [Ilyonectria sp. MPI-CAGE-AT-0026]